MKYFIKKFYPLEKNLFSVDYSNISVLNRHSFIYYMLIKRYSLVSTFTLDFVYFYFKNFFNKILFAVFFSKNFFRKFIYIISVGLGFRKRRRILRGKKMLELYIGNRHRLAYTFEGESFLFVFKRSNILIFSNSKNSIYLPLLQFRSIKKELVFKIKGFFINRVKIKRRIARM